jgi:hypothetical protein
MCPRALIARHTAQGLFAVKNCICNNDPEVGMRAPSLLLLLFAATACGKRAMVSQKYRGMYISASFKAFSLINHRTNYIADQVS